MPFSCCKKKKKASIESIKSIPIVKTEKDPPTFQNLELRIKDDVVLGTREHGVFPHVKFTPSTNEGMVKIELLLEYGEKASFSETSMDPKLSKTDSLIDVALRWFINYFETSKSSCSSITINLNQSMTSNPDIIWSHMCFTSSKINCIHTLTCYGNGGKGSSFVFDFPEKFCNQFTKLKTLNMYSEVKITELGVLSLKFSEINFERIQSPEEMIYAFIKNFIDGGNAYSDFKILRFNTGKSEESIVKNLKKNVDGAILWEDDRKMAQVATQIFQEREDQDREKKEYVKLIEFNPKTTFQFEQKNSGNGKKPVTATLCFYEGEGIFVKCGVLDSNMNIFNNSGGRPNYEEPS